MTPIGAEFNSSRAYAELAALGEDASPAGRGRVEALVPAVREPRAGVRDPGRRVRHDDLHARAMGTSNRP